MPHYVRTILVTSAEEDAARYRQEHLEHLRDLRAAGKLRVAGAFARGDGYFDIFEAKDLLEAEAIARSSPLVAMGVGTWMLREWSEILL